MTTPLATPSSAQRSAADFLRSVDPRSFLLPARTLKRIIRSDRQLGGLGIQVPHADCYPISRDRFLMHAYADEIDAPDAATLPEQLILIAEPLDLDSDRVSSTTLRLLWRRLFHAHLDLELTRRRAEGAITDATMHALTRELGQIESEEAIRVLRQESRLYDPEDWTGSMLEFVVVFFELRFFQPDLLPCTFPALEDLNTVEKSLRGLIDPDPILHATRLADLSPFEESPFADVIAPVPLTRDPATKDEARCNALAAQASRAREIGNAVRAAIRYAQATECSPPERTESLIAQSEANLHVFASRLQKALLLEEGAAKEWQAALPCVVIAASRGLWPTAARFLYDLQKACVDSERELYALDIVEWVCSLGKKAIKRPIPLQQEALRVKHLRSALHRLPTIQILPEERTRLSELLHHAIHRCEEHLRDRVRPLLRPIFQEVGFVPANLPERIAQDKITEELLDRIAERGFINMGDVRDAISRNQLKMPDVSPKEVLLGDPLLRANRRLALALDGVYHRGEIYLRWLQRLSSLFFGTSVGRWLVLFVILPFGGAYATAIFAQEMLHLGRIHVDIHAPRHEAPPGLDESHATPKSGIHWSIELHHALIGLGVLGVYYLLLFHVPSVRRGTWRVLIHLGRLLRAVFWDLPFAVLRWKPIRAVLDSTPVVFFRRRILRPFVLAALVVLVTFIFGPEGLVDELYLGLAVFAVGLVFFNSPLGRRVEEATSDWTMRNWYWVRNDVIPGLIALILDLFRRILDRIERVLYAVDEWLRFRPGDSRLALVVKPVLGLIWFFITYLVRVIINLFVEPTVNPVKHFPAVTVGAKLIIPLIPMWSIAMTDALKPFMGLALAGTVAGTIIILFPGIFGFAVWEFKENWKLYRANRERYLKPVMIGHHGETMRRLLRPGFHSGTVPKLFLKMRTAKAAGKESKAHKQTEELHHVSAAVQHFIEREFLTFLHASKTWGNLPLRVESIGLATNRITVRLASETAPSDPILLAFEESSGWLLATLRHPGFLPQLSDAQRTIFHLALTGLYKRAAVDLVREELTTLLPHPYRVRPHAIIVEEANTTRMLPLTEDATPSAPDLPLSRLLFSLRPLPWQAWVMEWEEDQRGQTPTIDAIATR